MEEIIIPTETVSRESPEQTQEFLPWPGDIWWWPDPGYRPATDNKWREGICETSIYTDTRTLRDAFLYTRDILVSAARVI